MMIKGEEALVALLLSRGQLWKGLEGGFPGELGNLHGSSFLKVFPSVPVESRCMRYVTQQAAPFQTRSLDITHPQLCVPGESVLATFGEEQCLRSALAISSWQSTDEVARMGGQAI